MTQQLTITKPDDWHLHVRDGAALNTVVPHTAAEFGRAIIMPNLKPPVTTAAQALEYKQRILAAVPKGMSFEPLMTLYLTDNLPAGPAEPSLHREQAFAIDDGEGTLEGIIDRLVVWRRRGETVAAEVVDFKFDGMGGAERGAIGAGILAEKTAFYAPQLRAYRRAVAALHALEPARVSCRLVFMRSGDIVAIDG